MAGIAGFIDYLPDGTPYMGIVIEDNLSRIQVFLANKQTANAMVKGFTDQLHAMAEDLRKTPNKVIPVNGEVMTILDKGMKGNGIPQR